MEFLADVWGTDQRFAKKIGERTLFVTRGESSSKISVDAQGSISSLILVISKELFSFYYNRSHFLSLLSSFAL